MSIQIISIDTSQQHELEKIENLYLKSFPKEERIDFKLLTAKAKEGKGYFLGLFDKGDLAGFTFYTGFKVTIYVFYIAIDSKYQSKGYGKLIIEHFMEKFHDHNIMLLVEELDENAENNEQRIRRKQFYLRNNLADDSQFLEVMGVHYELLHRQGYTADVEEFEEIQAYFFSDAV